MEKKNLQETVIEMEGVFTEMKTTILPEEEIPAEVLEKAKVKFMENLKATKLIDFTKHMDTASEQGKKAWSSTVTYSKSTWALIKKGSGKVWGGIKWAFGHMNKTAAIVGIASAFAGGAMTTTMGGAVVAGSVIAAAAMVAIELLANKKREEKKKKGFMAIAMAAIDAAGWAALTPYALTYGLAYLTNGLDALWAFSANATISNAILFMA